MGVIFFADRQEKFQSTLAPEGASDCERLRALRWPRGFNPRSHPRVRATIGVTGRTPSISKFQSTLAPEGASDPPPSDVMVARQQFQSTLAPEGASDPAANFRLASSFCFNPRSHPRVRATPTMLVEAEDFVVSIHARTRGCERPGAPQILVQESSFNPRSHPRVRATTPKGRA